MKIICDGHEYRATIYGRNMVLLNNYGTKVATAAKSPCDEYWFFETCTETWDFRNNEWVDLDAADTFHESKLLEGGFTLEEHFVRWFAAL